ncbi:MAG: DUF4177 domain-containing protein [Candidatus Glassbacteria bacterium]
MRGIYFLAIASILVVAALLVAKDREEVVRWDYAIVEMPYSTVTTIGPYKMERDPLLYQKKLNELGAEGWELVSSFKQYGDGARIKEFYIFKRES